MPSRMRSRRVSAGYYEQLEGARAASKGPAASAISSRSAPLPRSDVNRHLLSEQNQRHAQSACPFSRPSWVCRRARVRPSGRHDQRSFWPRCERIPQARCCLSIGARPESQSASQSLVLANCKNQASEPVRNLMARRANGRFWRLCRVPPMAAFRRSPRLRGWTGRSP
jgi:hypothetical protein